MRQDATYQAVVVGVVHIESYVNQRLLHLVCSQVIVDIHDEVKFAKDADQVVYNEKTQRLVLNVHMNKANTASSSTIYSMNWVPTDKAGI